LLNFAWLCLALINFAVQKWFYYGVLGF